MNKLDADREISYVTETKETKVTHYFEDYLYNLYRGISGVSAYLSATQSNITGNGTEATIICDSVITDRLDEYDESTGIFTAKEDGEYTGFACVKFNPGAGVTSCTIKIVTSNREYYLFRGITDNLIDSSGNATLSGSVLIDMDRDDTAYLSINVLGLGADNVDILPDETFFQLKWNNYGS